MKRKIYNKLKEWKEKKQGKTALLIEGARRIGKSYIVEQFGKNEYKSFIIIDFMKVNDIVKSWFDDYLNDLDTLFELLSNYSKTKLYPRESLIIFDEVQQCPKARASIKYLVADGRYDYIETGSLISIYKNVQNIVIPSEEQVLKMYPMDFEEFLWACDNEMLMDFIRKRFQQKKPLGQEMHRQAMNYFRRYMIVGGMPQAVLEYTTSRDFALVDETKRQILNLYRADIKKYATNLESKVTSIFDQIPSQLQKHEKKFKLSSLKRDAKFRDYDNAFTWLDDSRIINICYNTSEPNIGLRMNMDRMTLKCYMADTGLLISHAFDENEIVSEDIYNKLLLNKLEINEGMIVENIVAQILTSSGHKLYFYSNSSKEEVASRMEIDFLIAKSKITNKHNISPIEVKSGKNYTTVSLNKFTAKYKEYLNTPYILHTNDLEEKNGIIYLPLYMTGEL